MTPTLALLAGLSLAASAFAPPVTPPALRAPEPARSVSSHDTIARLARPITADFTEERLEDVLNFISELTGAVIEPEWRTASQDGLDKDFRVTLKLRATPALAAIEKILAKARPDGISENTWQMTPDAALQIGSKERLNISKRLVIYPIADLLTEPPRYLDVPAIDLQGALQQGGQSGGGGQSPIRTDDQPRPNDPAEQERRINRLIELITTFIEPDQWTTRGGTGAAIQYMQGTIIVSAPDYIHRQLSGYTYLGAITAPRR